VVFREQLAGQVSDRHGAIRAARLDREQGLMLLGREPDGLRARLGEREIAAHGISERRQRLIVRLAQGRRLGFAPG
jgi:hypothetical protein